MRNPKGMLAVAFAVALLVAGGVQAGEAKWFDMENCDMCKSAAAKPELMKNIKWETLNLSNGIATVETVPANMLTDYRALVKDMELKGKRLEKGEKMNLCGYCTAYGALMAKGAHREYVPTASGGLSLLTTNDPSLQKEIWAFHDRAETEFKKMMAMEKQQKNDEYEGHSH